MKMNVIRFMCAAVLGAVMLSCTDMDVRAEETTVQAAAQAVLMQASVSVHVRKGPAAGSAVLGVLKQGEAVAVSGAAVNGWYPVVYQGQAGYVNGAYLQAADAAAVAAAAQAQAAAEAQAAAAAQTQATAAAQAQAAAAAQAQAAATAQAQAAAEAQAQAAAIAQAAAEAQATAEAQAQAAAEAQAAAAAQLQSMEAAYALAQSQLAAAQEAQTIAPAPAVWIGDSRFVQMREDVGANPFVWVAASGKGYNWFVESGLARADAVIGNGTRVLINLGVNDTGNADKYIELFNRKAAEWVQRGAVVYYASVNPVWTNPHVTKERVEAFNTKLQSSLAPYICWIDSYNYLLSTGLRIVDGLHYDEDTNRKIYAYYMAYLFPVGA